MGTAPAAAAVVLLAGRPAAPAREPAPAEDVVDLDPALELADLAGAVEVGLAFGVASIVARKPAARGAPRARKFSTSAASRECMSPRAP